MFSPISFVKSPLVPLGILLASSAIWAVSESGDHKPSSSSTPSGEFFYLRPMEQRASETVADWAASADLVVTANLMSEQVREAPNSETARDQDIRLLGRTVSMNVTDIIWRARTSIEPDPKVVVMDAFGVAQEADGSTREIVARGAVRLEPGHSYLLALRWAEAECSPGDETKPARWSVIGSGGALPADGGRIGVGEFQGTVVDLTENGVGIPLASDSVLSKFAGEIPEAIVGSLKSASSAPVREPVRGNCEE